MTIQTTPKKGFEAVADYVINGKKRKSLSLGIVTKFTKKSFYVKDEEGNSTERFYTFGASNGVRLKGFRAVETPVVEAEINDEEE